jgi:hypothetical protein
MGENKVDAAPTETQAPADADVVRLNLSCTTIRHYPPEHERSPDGMGLVVLDYFLNGEPHTEQQAYLDEQFPGKARADVVAMQQIMVLHNMTRRISQMLTDGGLE